MRLDKFLWCVRLFKKRSLSAEACKNERIRIDDEPAKPSRMVKAGMVFVWRNQGVTYQYEVLDIPPSRVGAALVEKYLKDLTPESEKERKAFIDLAKNFQRKKGLGRPTKKDRRDLDSLM